VPKISTIIIACLLLIKRSNLMQQYADIYLLQSHSTCFGCHSAHHQELLYHLLISVWLNVALDEVTLSLVQVDDMGWWWSDARNHTFPGTRSFNPLTTVYFRSTIYHLSPTDPNRIIWYTILAKWLQCFISVLCCLLAIRVLFVTHLEFYLLFCCSNFYYVTVLCDVHAEYYITAEIIAVLR